MYNKRNDFNNYVIIRTKKVKNRSNVPMIKNTWKTLSLLAFCGAIVLANPADAKADEVSGPGLSSGNYIATVEAETVNISTDESGQEVLMAASRDHHSRSWKTWVTDS